MLKFLIWCTFIMAILCIWSERPSKQAEQINQCASNGFGYSNCKELFE